MNIKTIVDKICRESDIPVKNYPVADRLEDVNQEYLKLIRKAARIGSRFPISDGSNHYEDFTLVDGDNTFTRTIPNRNIIRVQYRKLATDKWECLDRDTNRCANCYSSLVMRFTANNKKVFVDDANAGFLRVTVEYPGVTLFTQADYDTTPTPPSPDWLDETYHDLLWLKPAIRQCAIYEKKRKSDFESEYKELLEDFLNDYRSLQVFDSELDTDEPENYR